MANTNAMHEAWQRLKRDSKDAQLRRAVRHSYNWLERVRSAAVVRFFERHVVELEKQLRIGGQRGFYQFGAAGGKEEGQIVVRP